MSRSKERPLKDFLLNHIYAQDVDGFIYQQKESATRMPKIKDLNIELRSSVGECDHDSIIVDEKLEVIVCDHCGQRLNPYTTIRRILDQWKRSQVRLDESF